MNELAMDLAIMEECLPLGYHFSLMRHFIFSLLCPDDISNYGGTYADELQQRTFQVKKLVAKSKA